MSLLRRRVMMENKKEYAGTLYVDAGFLDVNRVRYNSDPIHNDSYPDAFSTTYFPVQLNDVINCEELREFNADSRTRFYQSNGIQANYNRSGVINVSVSDEAYIYARLMMLNANSPIPSQLTVTHADGTVDTYKIIDRR